MKICHLSANTFSMENGVGPTALTIEVFVKFMKDPGFNCLAFILVEWVPANAHAHLVDNRRGAN